MTNQYSITDIIELTHNHYGNLDFKVFLIKIINNYSILCFLCKSQII